MLSLTVLRQDDCAIVLLEVEPVAGELWTLLTVSHGTRIFVWWLPLQVLHRYYDLQCPRQLKQVACPRRISFVAVHQDAWRLDTQQWNAVLNNRCMEGSFQFHISPQECPMQAWVSHHREWILRWVWVVHLEWTTQVMKLCVVLESCPLEY